MSELAGLLGYATDRQVVVVTARGVEIPIGRAEGWSVVEFTRTLAEIEAWPEAEHPLWWA